MMYTKFPVPTPAWERDVGSNQAMYTKLSIPAADWETEVDHGINWDVIGSSTYLSGAICGIAIASVSVANLVSEAATPGWVKLGSTTSGG